MLVNRKIIDTSKDKNEASKFGKKCVLILNYLQFEELGGHLGLEL